VSLASFHQSEIEELARSLGTNAGYCWLTPERYLSVIPERLKGKLPSALMMWERTDSGCTAIVCNGIRLDRRANALDQEPFGVVVYSSGASTGGVFVHHGAWANRTVAITPEVQSVLDSTTLGKYFPIGEVPSDSSGPLSDLKGTSHQGAFNTMMAQLFQKSG
jgi:hypothetical protein